MTVHRSEALKIWHAGVAAVDGYHATKETVTPFVPDQIIAIGKAAGSMARAAMERFVGCPSLVVTKDGHAEDVPFGAKVIEASHPVPDARSLTAGRELRETVSAMPVGSRLLMLVSGGASALAEDPVDGQTLEKLSVLNRRLLAAGLDITAMNEERRKHSRIKGGGLLSFFAGSQVETLAISDVPGDEIGVIGSGIGAQPVTAAFEYNCRIVASNALARKAAARSAQAHVLANEENLYGDVGEIARELGARLRSMPSGVAVFGGEPTIVLPDNPGAGGRNQALALELAREISGLHDLTVVVGGTDGTDGPTDAAGGVVNGQTWQPDAERALRAANSGPFLQKRNALLKTGPTGTNVMDLLVAVRS